MGQVSRKLKKYIFGIVLGIALMCGTKSYAQYNREYFFWVGRSCMMNNDYQEAIRTLNMFFKYRFSIFRTILCAINRLPKVEAPPVT